MSIYNIQPNSVFKLKRSINALKKSLKLLFQLEAKGCESAKALIDPLSLLLTILCNQRIHQKLPDRLLMHSHNLQAHLAWVQTCPALDEKFKKIITNQLFFIQYLSERFSGSVEKALAA